MRVFASSTVALAATASLVLGQQIGSDLATAVGSFSQLSTFQQLLTDFPGLLLSAVSQNGSGLTVLAPSNDAFQKYMNQTGQQLTSLPLNQLVATFRYHIMAAKMTSKDFTVPRGVVVPTLLKDQLYNNRTAGPQLVNTFGADAAQGNVLFVSQDPINPAKLKVRQASNVSLRGGLGETATMDPVDGQWSQGYFQIIDT